MMVPTREFETDFTYQPILGGSEDGVTRRDPSPVIRVDGHYHLWYSRSTQGPSGYYAEVWHATSDDGKEWTERGVAIDKGSCGTWDENGVFTPTILSVQGRYYLFYTAVPKPFSQEEPPTPTAIGIAIADAPDGPWVRFGGNPVLQIGVPGEWDSCRVDDACLLVRNGEYWLYYKGRQQGLSPAQTKMGLAIAQTPTGPYLKHPDNPVLNSGHEVCVWPHRTGVAAMVAPTGPHGSTIQYSEDGLRFVKQTGIVPPRAPGPYRTDAYADVDYGQGFTWGICQNIQDSRWPFLMRFDCDLRAEASPTVHCVQQRECELPLEK